LHFSYFICCILHRLVIKFDLKLLLICNDAKINRLVQSSFVFFLSELPLCLICCSKPTCNSSFFCNAKNVPKSLFFHFDDDESRSCSCANTLQMQCYAQESLFTKIFKVVICITHLTLRRHFTFHQQRFNIHHIPPVNLPYPSRLQLLWKFSLISHNKPYFIHCWKKKLLAFPDLDSIHLFTCLWRNYPIFGYFKSSCHF
jgi:hypothetical protein